MKFFIFLAVFVNVLLGSDILAEEVKNPFVSLFDRLEYKEHLKYIKKKDQELKEKQIVEEKKRMEIQLRKRQELAKQMMIKVKKEKQQEKQEQEYKNKDVSENRFRSQRRAASDSKKTTMPKVELQGIIWNADMPQVIINGQVYKVGDKILDKIDIVSIKKNSVNVVYNDLVEELKIPLKLKKTEHY
jgi:hypothetical protein